jgi:hypothetical protein
MPLASAKSKGKRKAGMDGGDGEREKTAKMSRSQVMRHMVSRCPVRTVDKGRRGIIELSKIAICGISGNGTDDQDVYDGQGGQSYHEFGLVFQVSTRLHSGK